MKSRLATEEDVKQACLAAEDRRAESARHQQWLDALGAHLRTVLTVSREEFATVKFQRTLWNSEAVSGVGWGGAINVEKVIADPAVVERLWAVRSAPLPPPGYERTRYLVSAFNECRALVEPHVTKIPRQKLFNVLAALQPTEFVTISWTKALRELAREMGLPAASKVHAVEVHRAILDRLDKVLGPVDPAPARAGLQRMTLPWLLFINRVEDADAVTVADPEEFAGYEKLVPLPAARRRRGMLAISGSFATVRGMVEFAKDGCMREDLREHIRSFNNNLSPAAVNTNLNALMSEWGVLQADGNRLALTPRGEALLESGDPNDVSDWLLTKILGFDHILYQLRARPGASRDDLRSLLKQANPGWKTNFTPDAMISWQQNLGLVARGDGRYTLTEEGGNWAERIHWIPEMLPAPVQTEEGAAGVDLTPALPVQSRPSLADIIAAFPSGAVFPDKLIARLDAGLWSNPRRHFVVLAGLSGSGKTLLACSYARALGKGQDDAQRCLYTLPVRPGWHDPASVFGYINPLAGEDTYMRTGFLEFLLRASADPARLYTVVLDEMNLSHPEQYLAPLLSAMETGDAIELHTFEGDICGVPPRLAYPGNLLIIGTVNMDETTFGLSDKILDRATVLEFWDVDVDAYPAWGARELPPAFVEQVRTVLSGLCAALRQVRLHFGWRTIGDVLGYVEAAARSGIIDPLESLDQAIFSKILPKLRGEDTTRLRAALEQTEAVLRTAKLMESATKVAELSEDLRHTGSARFWR